MLGRRVSPAADANLEHLSLYRRYEERNLVSLEDGAVLGQINTITHVMVTVNFVPGKRTILWRKIV